MVTIRISDRQRLIQPYIHNYAWLLFAALALYSAHLASSEEVDGEKLDPQARSNAVTLRSQCMQLVGDCLMKAHQGKGDCFSCTEAKVSQPSASCEGKAPAEVKHYALYRGYKTQFSTTGAHPSVELYSKFPNAFERNIGIKVAFSFSKICT